MKTLHLMRHGIAVPSGTPGYAENDRPLTDQGEREIRKIALGLSRLKVRPDIIACSPLPRARRTAEIVHEILQQHTEPPGTIAFEILPALSVDSPLHAHVRAILTRTESRILAVGHNMTISELVRFFCDPHAGGRGGFGDDVSWMVDLKTGGVATLKPRGSLDAGRRIAAKNSGDAAGLFQLAWLASPKLLKKLGD